MLNVELIANCGKNLFRISKLYKQISYLFYKKKTDNKRKNRWILNFLLGEKLLQKTRFVRSVKVFEM